MSFSFQTFLQLIAKFGVLQGGEGRIFWGFFFQLDSYWLKRRNSNSFKIRFSFYSWFLSCGWEKVHEVCAKYVQLSSKICAIFWATKNGQFTAVPSETPPYSLSYSLFLWESKNFPKHLLESICSMVYYLPQHTYEKVFPNKWNIAFSKMSNLQ